MMRRLSIALATLVPLGAYCVHLGGTQAEACTVPEQAVQPIPLGGVLSEARAEVSGIAWYGDSLVLLPQYPEHVGNALYVLERGEVDASLHGLRTTALVPRPIPFDTAGIAAKIPGFEGFEAITFVGDDVFFSIESEDSGQVTGHIVRGRVREGMTGIDLDPTRIAHIPAQASFENMGYETLLSHNDEIVTFYELNGEQNPAPHAIAFSHDLTTHRDVPLAHLEYRMTDATPLDEDGRFWAVNFFWPGESWQPASCPLTRRFGTGASHALTSTVERLVELQYKNGGFELTETPPILLQLDSGQSRNWEGIVRFGDEGFLVMTDEHPSSILGFVARP